MKFTDKELALIAEAKKKVATARVIRIFIIIAWLIGIALMFAGVLISDRIVYIAVGAVFLSVALPQFRGGPMYEDLVMLLESKSSN